MTTTLSSQICHPFHTQTTHSDSSRPIITSAPPPFSPSPASTNRSISSRPMNFFVMTMTKIHQESAQCWRRVDHRSKNMQIVRRREVAHVRKQIVQRCIVNVFLLERCVHLNVYAMVAVMIMIMSPSFQKQSSSQRGDLWSIDIIIVDAIVRRQIVKKNIVNVSMLVQRVHLHVIVVSVVIRNLIRIQINLLVVVCKMDSNLPSIDRMIVLLIIYGFYFIKNNNLNDINMSAKSIVQSLEDSELIKIFLDFVQDHRLQYEKFHKEISYKCYEATWMLNIAKATGYGRTETEAYKNALKNLLELIMEDTGFVQYFSPLFEGRKVQKNERKDSSPPPKMQLKTQGHEPEEKGKAQQGNMGKIQYLGRPKQEIHHSKISLNNKAVLKNEGELQQAKAKLKILEEKLASILSDNKALKERIQNGKGRQSMSNLAEQKKKLGCENGSFVKDMNYSLEKSEKNLMKQVSKMGLASKIPIPKLNLQILPNYHKKSEKSLNDVLLAAYNEKHSRIL